MRLYHFTSRENLRSIQQSGLSLGTVYVSERERRNAVWLTSDPGPNGHGLESGGAFMSELDRQEAHQWTGIRPPAGARFPKIADLRIEVELEPGDRNLHDWLPWARRHLSAEWLAQLHPVASGNLKKAKTWRLYFGVVPPERFAAVAELEHSPSVVPLRPPVRLAS